ncbi:MAG: hypothetical protein CVV44_07195 [Spirochaetae bacterium HGW-Spirochaetae-1]|jgi:DNA-binding NarL/FixJ family response regulator|nr:MAG: hypothetical protein CVV44_07195 [Spirochaetae bacterium HGW-Spirochaetae-1]
MVYKKNNNRFRVLIVENNAVFRRGLEQLLNHEHDIIVYGYADSTLKALQLIEQTRPDLVIADISLKDGSGIKLIREIRRACPEIPVLVLSMHDESVYAKLALQAGATGYMSTQQSPETIIEVVHKILHGDTEIDELLTDHFSSLTTPLDH